ncbi:MAG: TIM barrel protein [Polyangia bacterium]|jgi:sugar phosphate isomerase/epimerase
MGDNRDRSGAATDDDCDLKIGNQTAFFAAPTEPFAYAVEHGFAAFEFFPDGGPTGRGWSADDVSAEQRCQLRRAAEAARMRISVHAALEATLLGEQGGEKLLRDVELARDLGACVLNLHLVPGDAAGCGRAALAVAEILRPLGITLALENTVEVGPDYVNQVFAQLPAASGARGVGLCFDMGHANLHLACHNDYLAYLDRLADHVPIVHAHIHENWGDGDRHLPLFTGPAGRDSSGVAGLLRRLRQRRFHGSLILEQWPAPPSLLLAARAGLRALARQ